MDAEFDLRSIFGVLRRRLPVVLAVLLLSLGLAAIAVFTITPIYSATTLVMVDPSDKNLLSPQNQLAGGNALDARIEGEVLLARSDTVLLAVIDSEHLVDDAEFGPSPSVGAQLLSLVLFRDPAPPEPEALRREALGKLASMIAVQRRGLTFLIAITARSERPEQAARLANATARAYIDGQVAAKVQTTVDARAVLLQQVTQARQDVIDSEGAFDRFFDDALAAVAAGGSSELAILQRQLAAISASREDALTRLAAARTALANADYGGAAARLANTAITTLDADRQTLVGQLSAASADDAAALRQRLTEMEADLSARMQSEIDAMQQAAGKLETEQSVLRQSLRAALLGSGLPVSTLTDIYQLQQSADLARQQYDQVLGRSRQLQAEATLQLPDSRIASEALLPGAAAWPNPQVFLLLAVLVGLVLGVTLAFVLENFLGGITTTDQLNGTMRTAIALSVPKTKMPDKQAGLANLMMLGPLSAYAESIRRIRAFIDQATGRRGSGGSGTGTIIVVTSTVPSEGKTTLSISIARSYALAGQRTLLVDCDLRRPSIHNQLEIDPQRGLVDALTADNLAADLTKTISIDRPTGLTVLASNRHSNLPTDELVAGRNFVRLLEAARKTFDVVVLDTSPLGPVVDGLYLARYADAVVYVVQWAATAQSEIRRSFAALKTSIGDDTPVIPVLNQQDAAASSYYRRYAGYYQSPQS